MGLASGARLMCRKLIDISEEELRMIIGAYWAAAQAARSDREAQHYHFRIHELETELDKRR